MKENKTYTSDDFERYYGGKMTSVEMHELEERALEDPFLADALEGYQFTTAASKDMAGLRSKILKIPNKQTNVFLISRNNNWLRIAAVLVLIAGATLIFYKVNLNSNKNPVVSSELQKAQVSDSVSLSAKIDSLKDDNMAFQQESPKSLSENNNSASSDRISNDKKAPDLNKAKNEKSTAKIEEMKVDEKSKSERESSIELASIKSERTADKKLMMERSIGTNAQKHNDTLGYMESNSKALNNVTSQPELEKTASSPAILSGKIDKSSRIKSLLVQANSKVDGQQLSSGNIQFDDYLINNLQPVLYKNTRQTGVVILSFVTDSTGKSGDIKTAYSTCNSCENQATELLKNGPLWEKNRTSEMVLIKFY